MKTAATSVSIDASRFERRGRHRRNSLLPPAMDAFRTRIPLRRVESVAFSLGAHHHAFISSDQHKHISLGVKVIYVRNKFSFVSVCKLYRALSLALSHLAAYFSCSRLARHEGSAAIIAAHWL